MSRDNVVPTNITVIFGRDPVHHPNRPRLSQVDTKLSRRNGKLARWRPRLSEFELDVIHRAGIKYHAADVLSRTPTEIAETTSIDDEIPVSVIDGTLNIKTKYHCSHNAVRQIPMSLMKKKI